MLTETDLQHAFDDGWAAGYNEGYEDGYDNSFKDGESQFEVDDGL